jgi:hypothetical protein
VNASSGRPGREEPEDVWAEAVAEDAEEQQRRTREGAGESAGTGPDLSGLVDEVRRLASTVGERLQQAQQAVTATSEATEGLDRLTAPLREQHPEVYRHLAAAGGELLAAYRAAVTGHERRWSSDSGGSGGPDDGEAPGGEHIDLD